MNEDLKRKILSATNLCNDTTGIIVELLYIDTKPVLEKIMLHLLTRLNVCDVPSKYFTSGLRAVSSIQQYMAVNEKYLIGQLNKEKNIKLIHNFITKYKKRKKLYISPLDDDEYRNLKSNVINIFAKIHPTLNSSIIRDDEFVMNNIIKWIVKTFDTNQKTNITNSK